MQLANLTLNLVDAALEFEYLQEPKRSYLGMSELGKPCARESWYEFRLCKDNLRAGRMVRLVTRGHREEPYVYSTLRKAGFTVLPVDPNTGEQFEFIGSYGHAKGHCDGFIYNLPELLRQWVLLEIKTHNEKNFKKLGRQGVKKGFPVHYCQMQRYMHASGTANALYIGVSKNTDAWHTEIVPYNADDAAFLVNKEMSIIESDHAPERLINDPEFYTCRFCNFRGICHMQLNPPVTCRTCSYIAIHDKGQWKCEHPTNAKSGFLTFQEQLTACPAYVKSFYL